MQNITEFLVKKHQQNIDIKPIHKLKDIQPGDYFAVEWVNPYDKSLNHAYAKCEKLEDDAIYTDILITESYYKTSHKPKYSSTDKTGWTIFGTGWIPFNNIERTFTSITEQEKYVFDEIEQHIKEHGKQNFIGVIDKDKKIVRWGK